MPTLQCSLLFPPPLKPTFRTLNCHIIRLATALGRID